MVKKEKEAVSGAAQPGFPQEQPGLHGAPGFPQDHPGSQEHWAAREMLEEEINAAIVQLEKEAAGTQVLV